MKKCILVLLMVPSFAFAQGTIEVTSFFYSNNKDVNDQAAELCGKVTFQGERQADEVLIVTDPGSSDSHYIARLTQGGLFCQMVRTETGYAEVSFEESGQQQALRQNKVGARTRKNK